MSILVTLSETSEWRQLVQQLPVIEKTDIGVSVAEQPVAIIAKAETLDSFAAVISKNSATTFVLCYQDPLLQFAAALDVDEEIQSITGAWLQQVSELLRLQRRFRKQLKLLCLQSFVAASPSDLSDNTPEIQALTELNVKLNSELHSPVALLVASQLFNQNAELSDLKMRLEASSLQFGDSGNPANAEYCWQAFKEMQQQSQVQHKALQQENTEALNRLYELQLNAKQQTKQQSELAQQFMLLQSEKDNVVQELTLTQQQLAAAEQLVISIRQQQDAEQRQAEQNELALDKQLIENRAELSQLQEKHIEVQGLLEDKCNQAIQLEQELQQLQQQQVAESQQAAQLEAELKQELSEQQRNIKELEAEKQELKQSYATLLHAYERDQQEYTAQLGNALEQLNAVTEALNAAGMELEAHKNSIEQTLIQNTKLEQDAVEASIKYQQQLTQLNERISELKEDLELIQHKTLEAETSKLKLADENASLLENLQLVQEQLEHLFLQNESANQQNADLLAQLERVRSSFNKVSADYESLSDESVHLKQQLQIINEQSKADKERGDQIILALEDKLYAAEQRTKLELQQLEQQSNEEKSKSESIQLNLKNELIDLRLNNSKLVAQLSLLQKSLQQLEHDKQRQQTAHLQEIKPLQREFAKLEKKFRLQRSELAGYKYQCEQLVAELNKIKNSVSWKAVTPIRVISNKLKKSDKVKERLTQDVGLIFTSEYFDAEWYLQTYPDLREAGVNPAEHYLKFGANEGRQPSAEFDGNWYLKRYPDVAASGINPLLHYIKFGRNEGRTASPKLLENHLDDVQG